jgi:hypothetical protein
VGGHIPRLVNRCDSFIEFSGEIKADFRSFDVQPLIMIVTRNTAFYSFFSCRTDYYLFPANFRPRPYVTRQYTRLTAQRNYIYIHTYIHTYTHTHARAHTHTHPHTRIHTYASWQLLFTYYNICGGHSAILDKAKMSSAVAGTRIVEKIYGFLKGKFVKAFYTMTRPFGFSSHNALTTC